MVYASTREAEMAIVPWTDEQKAAFVAMQFEAQTSHYRATMPEAEWHVVLVDERLGFEPVRDEGFYRLMEWRPRRVWRNE